MNKFVVAAAVAVAIGFGSAATARAQYVIPYSGVTPNGGVVSGNSIYDLSGGYQSYGTYISPYGTVNQRASYTNVYGNTIGVARGYNPYTGFGYARSFYAPGALGYSPNVIYPAPIAYPSYGFGGALYYRR
jgi:hypothetical protein